MENKLIFSALVKAQTAFGPALKANTNPHFKSKYADLAACIEAVIGALNSNGIALIQRQHPNEGGVAIETVFVHESGESYSAGMLTVPAAKLDPQGYGSALTYARRYSLMAACGIAPEDDDGNAGSKTARKPETKVDMSPKARADRMMTGVSAGDAAGVAHSLSLMPASEFDPIWAQIPAEYADKIIAVWPEKAAA
jgi:hypothetical protein